MNAATKCWDRVINKNFLSIFEHITQFDRTISTYWFYLSQLVYCFHFYRVLNCQTGVFYSALCRMTLFWRVCHEKGKFPLRDNKDWTEVFRQLHSLCRKNLSLLHKTPTEEAFIRLLINVWFNCKLTIIKSLQHKLTTIFSETSY